MISRDLPQARLEEVRNFDGLGRPLSMLIVSHATGVWGAERRLLDVAPLLREHGIRTTLACAPGPLADTWVSAGHQWACLDTGQRNGLRRPGGRQRPKISSVISDITATFGAALETARLARPFDLVQSHSLTSHLEVALAGRLSRRPVVLDLHDMVTEGLGRRVLGLAARTASASIANSAATAATVGGTSAKVKVVHPGVDTSRFFPGPANPQVRSQLTSRPDAPLVAILGRLDPNKGIQVLVDAMAVPGVHLSQAHLVVIGREHVASADFASELRAHAHKVLGERVRFIEPRDDIGEVLRSVDVMVNASRHEPFGRTVLEAQACGVPVVGTNAGGIPEFVSHEVTGLLVPPFDTPALAEALELLLGDRDLMTRLSSKGVSQALKSFEVGNQVAAIAEVYRYAFAGGSQ